MTTPDQWPIRDERLMIALCNDGTVMSSRRWTFRDGEVWYAVYSHRMDDDSRAEPLATSTDEQQAQTSFWTLVQRHGGKMPFWSTIIYGLKTRFQKRKTP